jgi:hypothetical protein
MGWSPSAHCLPITNRLLCDKIKFDVVRIGLFILHTHISTDSQAQSFNLPRFDKRPNCDGMVPVSLLKFNNNFSVMIKSSSTSLE